MRAATWLQAWDSQGVHRTGTPGDTAGAEWLAREAAALGAEVAMETFPLSRLDPIQTWIECDGRQIESVPVFDAPSTTAEGVTGDIASSRSPPGRSTRQSIRPCAGARGTRAWSSSAKGENPALPC